MKKYNIGLDIGTTSVGGAVVEDGTQNIMKKSDKALWGVRLFESADTAAGRRVARSTRRRYDRRRERIRLLQKEFKNEICKVDANFFEKLNQSKYHESDKLNKTILLTAEEKRQIREYKRNDSNKTIYHLRKKLIDDPSKEDIRLVYLAIHHIIKYRGNFLHKGNFNVNNLDILGKLKEVFSNLSEEANELSISEDVLNQIDYNELESIIMDESKNDIKVNLKTILNGVTENKKFASEFGKMIVGNKFVIKDLLMIESDSKLSISFDGTDYDDKYGEIENLLGKEISLLELLKELYDMVFLKKIFKGSDNASLSELMVNRYNQHKKDLRLLKDIFSIDRKKYNLMFRSKEKNKDNKEYVCIYDLYIHNKISVEDFRKELEKYLSDLLSKIDNAALLDRYNKEKGRILNDEFLPRITDSENGKYPYQLNKSELEKIIENQGKYYPFLLDKINNDYKIIKLLEFRIPYYVGPLNNKSPFAWLERKTDVKITPYNFDEVVDKEKTAEEFIKRMVSRCTYILKEYALPNNSILYSRFKVINELKQIKVNNEKIENGIQQKIIEELFMKTSGSITDKKFKEYIYASKDFEMFENDINVTGYSDDGKFANNMQSYIDFFGENGIFNGTKYNEKDADEIIEWITIFEDKEILKTKIENKYSDLNDTQVKMILSKKYSGWGRLSKKLLTGIYYKDKETGILKSIMDLMVETDENFMQIINNDEYKFQDRINKENEIKDNTKLNYDLVSELATSPAIKRGIYQSLRVVDEIIDYIGYKPQNIMIEMSREEAKKKQRKDSRKKYLQKLYEEAKKNSLEHNEEILKMSHQLKQQEKIDSEKLFLYFIQEGKCLYCGKPLNIEDLKEYEVDHILPQSIIKDDSLDNKALVHMEHNHVKSDSLVLPSEFRTGYMKKWWEHLKKIKLISASKFYRLTRATYKDEDIQGFINRQLVETRQITKHVANIINNLYDTNVIYLKANLSHNYRERYELYKFRDLNDYHHAFDAYLTAVLGEYKEKYMKRNVNWSMIKELNSKLREVKEYKKLNYGFVINSLDNDFSDIVNDIVGNFVDSKTGEVLFDAENFNKTVEYNYYRNDVLVSKKTEIRSGELYNQTKNKKGLSGVPLKKNMPTELYGSYTRLNPSYAVVVKYTKKGKEMQKMIGIPIYVDKMNDKNLKDKYIKDLLSIDGSDSYKIISKQIPFYAYLNWNGQICSLVGATDKVEVCNALEFCMKKSDMQKLKSTLNRLMNKKIDCIEDITYEENIDYLIKYIWDKFKNTYKLYENLAEELKQIIDDNADCTLENKEQLVMQLFSLLKCNSDNANLKFLNSKYSTAFGKKNGRTIEHAIVINKSVTGLRVASYEF